MPRHLSLYKKEDFIPRYYSESVALAHAESYPDHEIVVHIYIMSD